MIGESVVKPEGAVVDREGVWFKYGIGRYAMYHKDGEWRESAKITNENISDWVTGKVADEHPATYGIYARKIDAELNFHLPQVSIAMSVMHKCLELQRERGAEYDKAGQQERSFARVAQAFNAITGKDLTSAEVCLLLQVLKDVRQWSNPTRLHKDSAIDGVNYGALKVEELFNQFGETL